MKTNLKRIIILLLVMFVVSDGLYANGGVKAVVEIGKKIDKLKDKIKPPKKSKGMDTVKPPVTTLPPNTVINSADNISDINNLKQTVNNVSKIPLSAADNIALDGLTRTEFTVKFGKELAEDITAFSGKQSQYIQAAMDGKRILPKSGSGSVGGQKNLIGDDYINAVKQRGYRINKFLLTQVIDKPVKLLRGGNFQPDELAKLYNINIKSNNSIDVVNAIKNGGRTFNQNTLTSASLPSVSQHAIHSFAVNGWNNADIARKNPLKIIRELDAPAGTKGFNISKLSTSRGQQEFLMPAGLKTVVTDAKIEKIVFEGEIYDVIRVFEEIIP